MFSERLQQLIGLYFNNNITEIEKEELAQEISQLTDEEIQILLNNAWTNYLPENNIPDEISEKIISFFSEQGILVDSNENPAPVIKIPQRRRWLKTTLAAACILAVIARAWFWFKPKEVRSIVK